MSPNRRSEFKGVQFSKGAVGKHHFRIRERHVAEHLAFLMSRNAAGAVKLDLVLRSIALLPEHAGKREIGTVLPRISYEQLHDLCRPASTFLETVPEDEERDAEVVDRKREWVREQLQRLEKLNLVRRIERPGRRPQIIVLRDDGSGQPFDDPDGAAGNSYVTVSSSVLKVHLPFWGTPEIAAYLAAMVADRYARNRAKGSPPAVGDATWYQPLHWFSNKTGQRPDGHVAIPFSTRTLERGFDRLRSEGLVTTVRTTRNPKGGRFSQPRTIYTNHFHQLDARQSQLPERALTMD
jgi:hypothetical protein